MSLSEEPTDFIDYDKKLLDSRERIMSLFVQKVRQTMPSAKQVDDSTLENSLFEFLTSISKFITLDIVSDNGKLFEENIRASREHGLSRAQIPRYNTFRPGRRGTFTVNRER